MKATNSDNLSAKVITLAVQSALLGMFASPLVALADDTPNAEVTALTKPTNSVEVGAEYVPQSSAKFGEYNGLDQKGSYLIGNFDMRGGDAYQSQSGGDGTTRWEIKGADLGTTSREFGLDGSNQGKWNFGFGYDELRHNITDTYQTPFQGSMGGNNFTLPSNFGTITSATSGYKTAPGSNNLTAAQLSALNNNSPEVYSQRENTKFNAGFIFDSSWNVKFDLNHLVQTGAKLQGVAGDSSNGYLATNGPKGETPLVIMTPTNYTTDTVNLALNWAGDKSYATVSYYGSIFHDTYTDVKFQNPFSSATTASSTAGVLPTDMVSTMPSNEFHQMNVTGGYDIASTTKLVGGVSYARNTQNSAYGQDATSPGTLPQTSLNGLVVTTNAYAKLTNQTTKDLQLSADLKYNNRDNQTTSNAYNFYSVGDSGTGTTNLATTINAPMSNTKTQFDLDGDYRIDKNQKVNLTLGYEGIQRSCSGVNYPLVTPNVPGTGYSGNYTATTCAEVPVSNESKIIGTYKLKASDDLNFNAGLGYANRVAEINQLFYNPMQATGYNANLASQGYEIPGFMAYMDASRIQDILKFGANWQANDKLSFGFNGRYNLDSYGSQFGVQDGRSYSVNLDANYAQSEHTLFSAYATTQNKSRDLTNAVQAASALPTSNALVNGATKLSIPAGSQSWTNSLTENDLTVGVGAKQGGLMGNKLDLSGDLTYSLDKTSYSTVFNYASQDVYGNTCSSVYYQTCGSAPDITSDLLQLKLVGTYTIDKVSKVRVGYTFQRLNATDYFYNAYQYGSTPTSLLPTNQQAPSYSINVVSVSYAISF